jgi:DNA-binding phage protein
MALTRDFRETVAARAARDPAFKNALLTEALQAFLEGEVAPGLILLRDCINATVGFSALSKETHIPEKSLMRMVGPRGNPTASNLFAMVAALQQKTHTQAHVEMAQDETDDARLDAMTDDDIAKAAADDPDAPPVAHRLDPGAPQPAAGQVCGQKAQGRTQRGGKARSVVLEESLCGGRKGCSEKGRRQDLCASQKACMTAHEA